MSETDENLWQSNAFGFAISREQAVAEGIVEPTPEELAELRVQHATFHAEQRAEWAAYDESQREYAALRDRIRGLGVRSVTAVLDLHAEVDGRCAGDDMDGYDCEPPEWPCRTVEVVAAAWGLAVVGRPTMPREWAEGPCPEFVSPYPRRPISFPTAFVDFRPIEYDGDELADPAPEEIR